MCVLNLSVLSVTFFIFQIFNWWQTSEPVMVMEGGTFLELELDCHLYLLLYIGIWYTTNTYLCKIENKCSSSVLCFVV